VDKLVREFPDVFAFPRMTTTRQSGEHSWYALTGAELAEHHEEMAALQEAQELAGACTRARVCLCVCVRLGVGEVVFESVRAHEHMVWFVCVHVWHCLMSQTFTLA